MPETSTVIVGAVVGAVALPVTMTVGFWALGLSAAGPVIGGWFAAHQGAAIASGSVMAVVQSMAMTGAATSTATIASGALTGALIPTVF